MSREHDPIASVFVCDDSAVVRVTLARRLRAEGLRVVERASALDAIEASAAPELARCALLDLDLGGADGKSGVDVARAIRAHHPTLPIAFFTGTTTAGAEAEAAAIGQVFRKPDQLDLAVAWAVAHARR